MEIKIKKETYELLIDIGMIFWGNIGAIVITIIGIKLGWFGI